MRNENSFKFFGRLRCWLRKLTVRTNFQYLIDVTTKPLKLLSAIEKPSLGILQQDDLLRWLRSDFLEVTVEVRQQFSKFFDQVRSLDELMTH